MQLSPRETSSRFSYQQTRTGLVFLGGVAVGTLIMYLFDPRTGTRRRVVLRDKTSSVARRYARLGARLSRHLRNQLQGIVAVTAGSLRQSGAESDAKIQARVRSVLGRTTPHAHAVDVSVSDGRVSLRGTLPPHEAGFVVRAAELVHGVKKVENLITPPMEPGATPIQ
jgi:osmotically-inducible protein OsmY